jgi:hypothetical protein
MKYNKKKQGVRNEVCPRSSESILTIAFSKIKQRNCTGDRNDNVRKFVRTKTGRSNKNDRMFVSFFRFTDL